MKQYRILCFGDSVVFGAWDETGGGWVDMLRQKLHSEYLAGGIKTQVFNLGIGGEKSANLLARIENEIVARLNPNWEQVILIATGANDTRANGSPSNYECDPQAYGENLSKIIEIAKKYSTRILCVGLHSVQEKLTFKDLYYTNERFQIFDDINAKTCNGLQIDRVEMHREMLRQVDFDSLFFDMVHPNHKGHKWLFDKILPLVKNRIGV